tara:strand:+ start:471 stop:731 length:261 start_codon:yes stop_codon:yes gene_type:complete
MSKIEIYTKNICVFCDRAKNFFQNKNLSYVEYNIDENTEELKTMLNRSNGQKKFPQIFIDNYHVGGFDKLIELQNNGKLNNILKLR